MARRSQSIGRRAAATAGFTLLEVMIALAILGSSLVVLSQSHQNSVRAASRAKMITVAVLLARYKMVDVEDDLFEEGFSDFEKEDTGDFKDEGFDRYKYSLKIDKVELPQKIDDDAMSGLFGSSSTDSAGTTESTSTGSGSKSSSMMAMGGMILAKQFEMIRNVLEQAIRRVSLSVSWKEGTLKREVTVVAYFTDPRVVDRAASGQLVPSADSLSSSSGSTSATTGSSGSSTVGSPALGTGNVVQGGGR